MRAIDRQQWQRWTLVTDDGSTHTTTDVIRAMEDHPTKRAVLVNTIAQTVIIIERMIRRGKMNGG